MSEDEDEQPSYVAFGEPFVLDGENYVWVTPEESVESVEGSDEDNDVERLNDGFMAEQLTVTGTVEIEGVTGEVTVTHEDGTETTYEDVDIRTQEQAREEAKRIREEAPPKVALGVRTTSIDDLIGALQQARERGVERVRVNDDGQSRSCRPQITNNHINYRGMAPRPGDLREWVEL